MPHTGAERPGRGRRLLITAGPTHEPLDAVRYLANQSSGRLGVCLADAARDAGWDVTLLLGPTAVPPPDRVRTVRFVSTADLAALLDEHFPACDVLIMAAAVADYRPRPAGVAKLPRTGDRLVIELEPTPDLVAACAARKQPGQRVIGFALEEPEALRERALRKLQAKGLDAIVANPLDTMGSATIAATVLTSSGDELRPTVSDVGPAGKRASETPTFPSEPLRSPVPPPPSMASAAGGVAKADFARWLVRWLDTPRHDGGLQP